MADAGEGRPVAVVTGASRGIGRAIALRLASDGFDVLINHYRDGDAAASVKQEIDHTGQVNSVVEADVADSAAVHEMFRHCVSELGSPTAVICNAGIERITSFLDVSEDELARVIAVNFVGEFCVGQVAAKLMVEGGMEGRIVNISSVQAAMAARGRAHYGPTKAAVAQLTRVMALELAEYGITVNAVAPGLIETDMTREMLQDSNTRSSLLQRIPLHRAGTPDDVAGLVSFLVSPDATYMTGSLVVIDGGMSIC